MAKISQDQKKQAKEAATNFARKHWWGKYTSLEHLEQAFLAGVNYQRQIQEHGTEPSKQGSK